MTREQVVRFTGRAWRETENAKAAYWTAEKMRTGPTGVLRIGDELRRHARSVRPDWPSAAEREEDLAVHSRVARSLQRVRAIPGH